MNLVLPPVGPLWLAAGVTHVLVYAICLFALRTARADDVRVTVG